MKRVRTDVLILASSAIAWEDVGVRARAIRLPVIGPNNNAVSSGAVASYGHDVGQMWRRAAVYVDKVLRGASPADLPFEQPTRVELILNLQVAKEINLKIPQSLLLRADKVIE